MIGGGIFKIIQGLVKIKGGTDGTVIGNTGDALKTTATLDTTDPIDVNQSESQKRYNGIFEDRIIDLLIAIHRQLAIITDDEDPDLLD